MKSHYELLDEIKDLREQLADKESLIRMGNDYLKKLEAERAEKDKPLGYWHIDEAIKQEREACATLCDGYSAVLPDESQSAVAMGCALVIRNRK